MSQIKPTAFKVDFHLAYVGIDSRAVAACALGKSKVQTS
jgi:hypothetical protein